jgi:hypothetical protein
MMEREGDQDFQVKIHKLITPIYNPKESRPGLQSILNKVTCDFRYAQCLKRTALDTQRSNDVSKMLSQGTPFAGTFLYDLDRRGHLRLSDEAAKDNILMRMGEEPFCNKSCSVCKKPILTGMVENHAMVCANKSYAAMLVKRGAREACRILELEPSTREPKIPTIGAWKWLRPGVTRRRRADFSVILGGVKRFCDQTFTAKFPRIKKLDFSALKGRKEPATVAEESKLKDYRRDFTIPRGCFFPMGFDSHGGWGKSAAKLLTLANESYKIMHPGESIWFEAKKNISIAICKAATAYMDGIRTDWDEGSTGTTADTNTSNEEEEILSRVDLEEKEEKGDDQENEEEISPVRRSQLNSTSMSSNYSSERRM